MIFVSLIQPIFSYYFNFSTKNLTIIDILYKFSKNDKNEYAHVEKSRLNYANVNEITSFETKI